MNWWKKLIRFKDWKLENKFLMLAVMFTLAFTALLPINRIPDEMNHARMSWGVLHEEKKESFNWMKSVGIEANISPASYRELFATKIDLSSESFKPRLSLKSISFLPQIMGMMLGQIIYPSVGVIVMFGRLFNAIFYIVSVYFLLKYFKFGKRILFFVSLLPIMIQQASSLSYDTMNYIQIMLAFGFLSTVYYHRKFDERNLLQTILIAVFLLATKPNNILLLALLPFVPMEFTGKLTALENTKNRLLVWIKGHRYIFYSVALLLVLLGFKYFLRNSGGLLHYARVILDTLFNNQANPHLNSILTVGIFGYLGNFTLQLPLWLIFVDVVVLVLTCFYDSSFKFDKLFAETSLLLFIFEIVLIETIMYVAWTPIAIGANANISVGAQGRYFTPFLILLLPTLANLGDFKISERKMDHIMVLTLLMNVVVSLFLALPFYWHFWIF